MRLVIPVKPFAAAKQRLAPVLRDAQRAALACAMFEDVLDAAAAADGADEIVVVTADDAAARIAHASGCLVLRDGAHDLNAAVRLAQRHIGDTGGGAMLVVPGDLPMATAVAFGDAAMRMRSAPGMAIVRASRDGGTNLLACNPFNLIEPSFGADSFARHCRAARAAGVSPAILQHPGLDCDIDCLDDLRALIDAGGNSRAHAVLRSFQSQAPVAMYGRGAP